MGRKKSRGRGRPAKGAAGAAGAGTEASAGAATDATAGAGAVETPRSVGHVAVEVDRAAILAEAAEAAAEAPPDAPAVSAAGTQEAPAPATPAAGAPVPVTSGDIAAKAAEVAPALRLIMVNACAALAPNWEISQAESDGVADATALVLAHWMPAGVVDPKYMAAFALAGALYGVASARRNDDGTWRPLRKPPANTPARPPTPPATSAGNASNVTQLRV
jgi:hypothetical protein